MNRLLKVALAVALMTALSSAAFAQTTTTQTILSAAIANGTVRTITVASTTGISASSQTQRYNVWVDGELMTVQDVNTSTNVLTVARGVSPGGRATAHPTASVVFFGPAGQSPFIGQNPFPGTNCTAAQHTYLPLINATDGTLSNCVNSRWIAYNFKQWTNGHPVTAVVDAAYTATLADEFITYTSITATRILTLPAVTGVAGKQIVVINAGTLAGAAITVTAPNGQLIGSGTAPAATSSVSGNGSVLRLVSFITSTGLWGWATW